MNSNRSYFFELPIYAKGQYALKCAAMINFSQLGLRRGSKELFSNANFRIQQSERIGIIGSNGCGKSSLFALIMGDLSADDGELITPKDWRIAIMLQEAGHTIRNALDYVIDGDIELRALQSELEQAQQRQDNDAIAHALGELDSIQAYNAETRASQLLTGLGFKTEQLKDAVNEFSGGWRIRLNLAKALMRRSDLLLLDEPTNHLDLDAVSWLESWLQRYPGTLMLISHDRDFLDAVTQRTLHFERGDIHVYTGNYSAAEKQKAERLEQQQALYVKQQTRIKEIDEFVRRFRYKASKAKQAQSRLKELNRLERIDAAHIDSPFKFSLPCWDKLSDPLINMRDATLGYPDHVVIQQASISIRPGARLGILGVNGAGKTTLLKTLAGQLPLISGDYSVGEHLRIGYFAQHQLEALDMQASPLLHIQRLSPLAKEQDIRSFLGGFAFGAEANVDSIAHFSGGEKARLALAIVAWQHPNLLILDEPTNHLDLEMRHALTVALQQYQGAVLLVSHDRHLLRNSADELLIVADGELQPFDGSLNDYQRVLREQYKAMNQTASNDTSGQNVDNKKAKRQQAAQIRQQLQPLRKAFKQTDKQLTETSSKLTKLDEQIADPTLYQAENSKQLQQLLKEQGQLRSLQTELEERWLEQQDEMDSAEQSIKEMGG